MKKLLCYLVIIILFGLAIFPVVLRITLPDKENIKKEESIERLLLSCLSDKYITSTSYDGKKISMIIIKKIANNLDETNNNEETEDIELITNDLDNDFNELKTKGDVIYNQLDDGEVISIDFSVTDHPNLILNNLNNPIEIQKEIYERQGLTCVIKK